MDAQNRFMGKSFEIRPTGIAHAELIIPEERGPGYPKAPAKFGKGKVLEHYSWKKVTTNVSGFILGSPTIDHYGDMIVRRSTWSHSCGLRIDVSWCYERSQIIAQETNVYSPSNLVDGVEKMHMRSPAR